MPIDKVKTAKLQEMERKSQDLIRVFNPTEKDYILEWDRRNGTKIFRIKAQKEEILPRYLASKYTREMYNRILTEKAMDHILKTNKERVAKGMAELDKTSRTGEQLRQEIQFYNPPTDEAKKLIATIWLGVEREFGIDSVATEALDTNDNRPVFDRVLEDVVSEETQVPTPQPVVEPIKSKAPLKPPTKEEIQEEMRQPVKEEVVSKKAVETAVAGVSK